MSKATAAAPAKDLEKQVAQLSLLFEATRLLNSTLDLAELLELILKIARTELKADRGSAFVLDRQTSNRRDRTADAGAPELLSIVAEGIERQEIRVPLG